MIIWFTGQPGAGKTTLATFLRMEGLVDFVVDGDLLRQLDNPGFDEPGRRQNVDRAQAIAAYLHLAGKKVAVAVIAPYRDQRDRFKARWPVMEAYVHTTDIRGKEEYFVDSYEAPITPDVDLDTGRDLDETLRVVRGAMAALPRGT